METMYLREMPSYGGDLREMPSYGGAPATVTSRMDIAL